MNTMTVQGYSAKIEYDEEIDLSRGEIHWLSGGTPVVAHRQAQTEPESGPGVGMWTVVPVRQVVAAQSELHQRCDGGMGGVNLALCSCAPSGMVNVCVIIKADVCH